MSEKVKVFNLNTHELKEIFKGEEMSIAPQDYWRDKKGKIKEIDIYEANDFKGQYRPVPFDGSGKMLNDPRFFKMLRLEPVKTTEETNNVEDYGAIHKCMARDCKHISPSSEELEAHTRVRHKDIETLVLPEEDRAIKNTKEKRIEQQQKKSA